jgi:hypothetical protein
MEGRTDEDDLDCKRILSWELDCKCILSWERDVLGTCYFRDLLH